MGLPRQHTEEHAAIDEARHALGLVGVIDDRAEMARYLTDWVGDEARAEGMAIAAGLYAVAGELGGSISAEHGVAARVATSSGRACRRRTGGSWRPSSRPSTPRA